jgi:hypothetical protein
VTSTPTCPYGHYSGEVVRDGLLVLHGFERDRFRCSSPDGSYHRFLGPLHAHAAAGEPQDSTALAFTGSIDPSRSWTPSAGDPGPRLSLPLPPLPRRHSGLRTDGGRYGPADATRAFQAIPSGRPSRPVTPARRPVEPDFPQPVAPSRDRRRPVLVLPHPPTEDEKYWYLGAQNRWFLWVGAAGGVLVLSSLVRFALDHPVTWVFLGLVLLRVVTSAVGLASASRRRRLDLLDHDNRVLTWNPDRLPSVDVFLPSAGEDVEILNNTFHHVARLQWPGDLQVHVLDDSARAEVAELAAAYGFVYHSRPDRGRMKKAGNLKYGFDNSHGDLIAVFDADFVPRPEYLFELVPYFEDATVGIVQSPQFFDTHRGMNWLQRAAGATQELFYRLVQPARDASNAAICVGTCAIYRRAGLVRSGGFAQISHSEDVHTGVNLLKVGLFVRYVPILVSKGLCPDTLSGFLNQQYRWCSGSMSLLVDRRFHAAPLTLKQRLCFFSGFLYYISTAVFVFTVNLPSLTMLWLFPEKIAVDNYRLLAPALAVTFLLTPVIMRGRWRPEVLRVQMIYSFAHAVAIYHTLSRRVADWVPTGAAGKGTPLAVTIRRVMTVTVLVGQVALWSGIAVNLPELGVQTLWPMIAFAAGSAYVQLPALLPLRASRPDGVLRRPPYPTAPAGRAHLQASTRSRPLASVR